MDKRKKFNLSSIFNPTSYQQTQRNLWIAVAVLCVVLIALLAYIAYLLLAPQGPAVDDPQGGYPGSTHVRPTTPDGQERVMLDHMVEWYMQNSALAGWLRIDGTMIDYPVVFTPSDPDKYLRKDFRGKFSMDGTLFIDGACTILPESDNTIIYGHNMKKGTMFRDLLKYADQTYWQEHPIIEYSTLYEERQYEIIAVFYDKVYRTDQKVFKFYQFVNYENEGEFRSAMDYFQEKAEYDTGVEPQFGDRLLTLVTCSKHERNGRFVVVARQITEETTPSA